MRAMRPLVLGLLAAPLALAGAAVAITATQPPETLVGYAVHDGEHRARATLAGLVLQHASRVDPDAGDLFAHTLAMCDRGDAVDRPRCYAVAGHMIERGAHVDKLSSLKIAPLHQAALAADDRTMSFLIEHHADPNVRAGGYYAGMTPLGFVHLLQRKAIDGARKSALEDMASVLEKAGGVDVQPTAQGEAPKTP